MLNNKWKILMKKYALNGLIFICNAQCSMPECKPFSHIQVSNLIVYAILSSKFEAT